MVAAIEKWKVGIPKMKAHILFASFCIFWFSPGVSVGSASLCLNRRGPVF